MNCEPSPAVSGWQHELAQSFKRLGDLLEFLEIDPQEAKEIADPDSTFPFKVTRSYAARMRKRDLSDPLFLQVFPNISETVRDPRYVDDPVGDMAALVSPGLLHKYQGRVLLVTTGACAIHCRYCFRREFPYGDFQLTHQRQSQALDYIRSDPSIREVILSGGDPLVLSDDKLRGLLRELGNIPHLCRIRIHSRLPVVLPTRITDTFLKALSESKKRIVMVIHANHASEISQEVNLALAALADMGVTLLNQAVLLNRINASVATLRELSERLFESGVMPYYLHLLDKVAGSGHFDVPESLALELRDELRRQLPGYLVPRLVRENAGQPYKDLVELSAEGKTTELPTPGAC